MMRSPGGPLTTPSGSQHQASCTSQFSSSIDATTPPLKDHEELRNPSSNARDAQYRLEFAKSNARRDYDSRLKKRCEELQQRLPNRTQASSDLGAVEYAKQDAMRLFNNRLYKKCEELQKKKK
jgi:hypothetical protein